MNIELDEVVSQDVSDYALELAAGGTQGDPHGVTHVRGLLPTNPQVAGAGNPTC